MRVKMYKIRNAEELKRIVPLMKWQKEADRTAAFAKLWQKNSNEGYGALLEIGECAKLYKTDGNARFLLGTVVPKAAQGIAPILEEV